MNAEWILSRLSEPSSWRGIIALLTACGITLAPDQQSAITALGLATIGLINVFRKEKSGDTIVTTAPVTITQPVTITTEPKG